MYFTIKSEIITSGAETPTSNELPAIILQTIAQTTSLSDEGHTHHYCKFNNNLNNNFVFVLLSA